MLYIFKCIYINKCYIFLLCWSFYHYIISFFVFFYQLCFKVYFVWYEFATLAFLSFLFSWNISLLLFSFCMCLYLKSDFLVSNIWICFVFLFFSPNPVIPRLSSDWSIYLLHLKWLLIGLHLLWLCYLFCGFGSPFVIFFFQFLLLWLDYFL